MIRDYPDVLNAPAGHPSSPTAAHFDTAFTASPHASPSIPPQQFGLGAAAASVVSTGKLPPPPRHPAATITAAQTTYTPYVPRRRQQSVPGAAPPGRPVVASSVLGGVTARHVPGPGASLDSAGKVGDAKDKEREREREAQKERERDGPSAALLDKVRALDALPRVGALRTLDLRGNDLRVGFFFRRRIVRVLMGGGRRASRTLRRF
jgi:protein phosphatase 1 regulatory subunit 37